MSIRKKLIIVLLLLSTVPYTVLELLDSRSSQRLLEEQIGAHSLEFTRLAMTRILEYVEAQAVQVRRWAGNEALQGIAHGWGNEDAGAFLGMMVERHEGFPYVLALNELGKIAAAADTSLIGQDWSTDPLFTESLSGRMGVRDVAFDEIAQDHAMLISSPIRADGGEVIGVLVAALKWEAVNELITGLRIANRPQSVANHIMLMNDAGLTISCYDPAEVFRTNLADKGIYSFQRVPEDREGWLVETTEHGVRGFSAYTYARRRGVLPRLHWRMVLHQDAQDAFALVQAMERRLVLVLLISVPILIVVSVVLGNRISRPVRAIAAAAAAVGAGNLKERVKAASKDEIGQLASSFNLMAADLERSNENLLRAKRYTDNILRSMADPLIVLDADHMIQTVNRAAMDRLGYEANELVGRNLEVLFGESGARPESLLAEHRVENIETRLRTKDGGEIHALLNASAMTDDEGEVVSIVCVFRDVTERDRTETALRESEERYRRISDAVTDYICTVAVRDGQPVATAYGPACAAVTGYSSEELAADQGLWERIVVSEDLEIVRRQTQRLLTAGEAEPIEHRIVRRDGAQRWVANTPVPHFAADGSLTSYDCIVRDITYRKIVEQRRELSRGILERLNRSGPREAVVADVAALIRDHVGCEAAAVRLREDDAFPFVAAIGVSDEFLRDETAIYAHGPNGEIQRDARGRPVLECLCGMVLRGETDAALPGFTSGGSFWSGSISRAAESLPADRRFENLRGRCLREGYESMALVPLRLGETIIGLLQLSDRGEGLFTAEIIGFIEEIAVSLAIGLARKWADEELARSHRDLRALAARLAEAQELERKRLAQELHDRVGQTLTALNINMGIMLRRLSPPETAELEARLNDSLELLRQVTGHVQDVMAELSPIVLDDYGLKAALEWYADLFTARTGVPTQVAGRAPGERLARNKEMVLYRIAQEAMNNVTKHAQADTVDIALSESGGLVHMVVTDDGVGFDLASQRPGENGGWGLAAMRERAAGVGARVDIESIPGAGTRVIVNVER